jgi:hypothetical protein
LPGGFRNFPVGPKDGTGNQTHLSFGVVGTAEDARDSGAGEAYMKRAENVSRSLGGCVEDFKIVWLSGGSAAERGSDEIYRYDITRKGPVRRATVLTVQVLAQPSWPEMQMRLLEAVQVPCGPWRRSFAGFPALSTLGIQGERSPLLPNPPAANKAFSR